MPNKTKTVRGTKDLIQDEILKHKKIIDIAFELSQYYCYQELSTPIIEHAEIFDRSLGITSDIISKEIYAFKDKSNNILALRPEFTASIIRAYISNGWQQLLPLKLFSHGPIFRYDRPQKGRQRQFHQINFEHLGANTAYSDAEILKLADHLGEKLEIKEYLTLELNSLGCFESRKKYNQVLFSYFSKFKSDLSEESQMRLESNPLRILDSKNLKDKEIAINAPEITSCYSVEARNYFDKIQDYLTQFNVEYRINKNLVRGLDYYCHTTFEFTTKELGAQDTIIAGGRYDKLSTILGGPDTKAIGFAAGIERIALLSNLKYTINKPIIIILLDNNYYQHAIQLVNNLRNNSIATFIESEGSIDKKMKKAYKANAEYIIFIGENESKNNSYKIKNLTTKKEITVNTIENIIKIIK